MPMDMRRITWKRFFESKLFFVAGIGALILLSVNLTRAQLKDRAIRAEIRKFQEEVDLLEKEQGQYEDLRAMLESAEFLEKEARRSLGYAKPGEQVVVIEENVKCKVENGKCADENASQQELSNPKKWWLYFFGEI